MGVWCFSGFSGLFPLILAALYGADNQRSRPCLRAGDRSGLVYPVQSIQLRAGVGSPVLGMTPVTFIVAASAITIVVVSLFTTPPSQHTIDKFFAIEKQEA